MAMNIQSNGAGEPILDMNTTPLIDVMMVLLILFIITLPIATNITSLELPNGPPGLHKRETVTIDIDYDGVIALNGVLVQDMNQLAAYFRSQAQRGAQPELHVRPDARARYESVAQVLASAQRNGMKHIGVVGRE